MTFDARRKLYLRLIDACEDMAGTTSPEWNERWVRVAEYLARRYLRELNKRI